MVSNIHGSASVALGHGVQETVIKEKEKEKEMEKEKEKEKEKEREAQQASTKNNHRVSPSVPKYPPWPVAASGDDDNNNRQPRANVPNTSGFRRSLSSVDAAG